MKKTPRRLTLTKETIRVMSDVSMREVRGAAPTDTIVTDTCRVMSCFTTAHTDESCDTCNCTDGCPQTNFCTFKAA